MGAARTAARTFVVLAAQVALVSAGATALADQADEGVDIAISIGSSTYYYLPTSTGGALRPQVTVPASTQERTIRVTFDLTRVYDQVSVPADERCGPAEQPRIYHCDRVLGPRQEPVSLTVRIPLEVRSGVPAGPVGQVRARATQLGNTDPNPGNTTLDFTIDVETGQGQTMRVDGGEVTGRIGETVTVPATMTNLGPDTLRWAATSFATMVPGLEVVGHEGCAGTGYVSTRLCDTEHLAGGQSRTIGVRVRIDGCPDPHTRQFGHAIHASSNNATLEHGTFGSVTVEGCGPASTGGETGGRPGGASAGTTGGGSGSPAGDPGDAASPAPPADNVDRSAVDFAAAESAVAHGTSVPDATAAGDWVTVSDVRRGETGIGLVGLHALLTLPVILLLARAIRWVPARVDRR
jgi:hypothetical protein